MKKQFKQIKKLLKKAASGLAAKTLKIAKADVKKTAKKSFGFVRYHVKIRPRLRLVFKFLTILVLIFFGSSEVVALLMPKEAEIRADNHSIFVANQTDEDKSREVEISYNVSSRRSPFDLKFPVSGYISQRYSSYHRAYDIASDFGASIKPVGSGIVEFAGKVTDGKGNIVIVDHGDGLKSLYAHMGRIEVGVGNMVNSDTPLGTVGITGRTTGPHVHLEIYDNENLINPGSVLPE